jgi:hypothetical protein
MLAIEVALGVIYYIPSFIKIEAGVQTILRLSLKKSNRL